MDTHTIDPDGTPHSKFVNDIMMRILQECPLPAGMEGEPTLQQKGEIALGTLAAINAGVLANLLREPEDIMSVLAVISQLATITYQEFGTLTGQIEAARNPQ